MASRNFQQKSFCLHQIAAAMLHLSANPNPTFPPTFKLPHVLAPRNDPSSLCKALKKFSHGSCSGIVGLACSSQALVASWKALLCSGGLVEMQVGLVRMRHGLNWAQYESLFSTYEGLL